MHVCVQVEGLLANIRSTPMTIPILRSSGIGKDITRLMKWNPPPDPAFARVAAAAKCAWQLPLSLRMLLAQYMLQGSCMQRARHSDSEGG